MKKHWNIWLMATLVMAVSMSTTSCKDDDDSKNEEQQRQETQQAADANEFWAVVGQLVGIDQATEDYASKTFTPTIGEAVKGNETVRRVMTNDMVSAADRFCSLAGLAEGTVDEDTPSYTWSNPVVGTLTYTKNTDGQCLATVDVNIRQVPNLRQIVYLTPEQAGTNFGAYTNCYYHFGDVISRVRPDDGVTEYWICVRPALEPAHKGDSHWVTVSPLPAKNVKTYKASNKFEYAMPTNLGQDNTQMQNLAEMLFAMLEPDLWDSNIKQYRTHGDVKNRLKIFCDLSENHIDYFSRTFWRRVSEGWDKTKTDNNKADLWQTVFGRSHSDFSNKFNTHGLHLLYKGFSWHWNFSNDLTIYEYVYNGNTGATANMHRATQRDITHKVVNKSDNNSSILFNVNTLYTQDKPYLSNLHLSSLDDKEHFFGESDNADHYIIRHASGNDLAKMGGGKYDKKTALKGFNPVFVYTVEYGIDVTKKVQTRDDIVLDEINRNGIVIDAPNDVRGVYQMGDVLECEEDGSKWFCIGGKPEGSVFPFTDREATFVSLDIPQFNDVKAQGLPTEAQLNEYSYRFANFIHYLNGLKDEETERARLELYQDGRLGVYGNHIKEYAGVDLHDLINIKDSVWNAKYYNSTTNKREVKGSKSGSYMTCMAYDDGSNNHQAVARIIKDITQAGDLRGLYALWDGKKRTYQDWYTRVYKHYESFDPARMNTTVGDDVVKEWDCWQQVGGTLWQWYWAIDNQLITLQDLTDDNLVNKYAPNDKWVRLPFRSAEGLLSERQQPRTKAESSVKPSDFFYANGKFATNKRSMSNEPVLFMRFMKIEDPGFRRINLTSTDGRHFKVVHLLTLPNDYKGSISALWCNSGIFERISSFYLDNTLTVLEPIPGTPAL